MRYCYAAAATTPADSFTSSWCLYPFFQPWSSRPGGSKGTFKRLHATKVCTRTLQHWAPAVKQHATPAYVQHILCLTCDQSHETRFLGGCGFSPCFYQKDSSSQQSPKPRSSAPLDELDEHESGAVAGKQASTPQNPLNSSKTLQGNIFSEQLVPAPSYGNRGRLVLVGMFVMVCILAGLLTQCCQCMAPAFDFRWRRLEPRPVLQAPRPRQQCQC